MGILSDWVLTGQECVDRIRQSHQNGTDYDVCLVDLKMPDMDGVEVARKVREEVGPETTIIIITAYDWTNIETNARKAGVDMFLTKPVFDLHAIQRPSLSNRDRQGGPCAGGEEDTPGTGRPSCTAGGG